MNHDEFKQLVSLQMDAPLPPETRAQLDVHVASCESCQTELAELEALRSGIRAAGDVELPYRFSLDVSRSVFRSDRDRSTWEGVEQSAKSAFMVLTLLVAAFLIMTSSDQPKEMLSADQIYAEAGDSLQTAVLMKQGDLSKDDVLLSVLYK